MILDAKEIEKNKTIYNSVVKINSINRGYRIIQDANTGLIIDTQRAVYLENIETGYHSYTFNVKNTTQNEGVKNVFFSFKNDGTYKKYLVTYNLTLEEVKLLRDGEYVDVTNKVSFNQLADNAFAEGKLFYDNETNCLMNSEWVASQSCGSGQHTVYNASSCEHSIKPQWGYYEITVVSCPDALPDDSTTTTTTGGGTYGGGSSPSDDTTTILPPEPIEVVEQCLLFADLGYMNGYTPQMSEFLKSKPIIAKQIETYIEENDCSEQTQLFIIQAIIALMQGGEVDFEDEIIKDPSFIGSKADCVYELLKSTNNNLFKNVMEVFANGNAKYKLLFKIGDVNAGNEAETSYNPNTEIITVTISEGANSQSSLEIANTILHEGIHAELKRIILNGNTGPNPLPIEQYTYLVSLHDFYQDTASALTVSGNAQHTFMVYYHVDPIANAIRSLDGNLYSLDYYKYFAWTGLEEIGMLTIPQILTQTQFNNFQILSNTPLNDNHNQECDD